MTSTFAPIGAEDGLAGSERIEEVAFVDGHWRPGCVLNGDQRHQGLPPGRSASSR